MSYPKPTFHCLECNSDITRPYADSRMTDADTTNDVCHIEYNYKLLAPSWSFLSV